VIILPLLSAVSLVGSPMDADTDELVTSPPTEGHNLWALARELDLVRTCPVCVAGALNRVFWHHGTPSWLQFSCGHISPPYRSGRHRLVES
jgi:hypothetical protein